MAMPRVSCKCTARCASGTTCASNNQWCSNDTGSTLSAYAQLVHQPARSFLLALETNVFFRGRWSTLEEVTERGGVVRGDNRIYRPGCSKLPHERTEAPRARHCPHNSSGSRSREDELCTYFADRARHTSGIDAKVAAKSFKGFCHVGRIVCVANQIDNSSARLDDTLRDLR